MRPKTRFRNASKKPSGFVHYSKESFLFGRNAVPCTRCPPCRFGAKYWCGQSILAVLYLTLNGDLCALREVLLERFDPVTRFFEEVYPQPGIVGFLEMLPHLDGATIDALPQKALTLYSRLSVAFTHFLQVETAWGLWDSPTPMFKLLLGNFSRHEMVRERLRGREEIQEAARRLAAAADVVIQEIFDFERSKAVVP